MPKFLTKQAEKATRELHHKHDRPDVGCGKMINVINYAVRQDPVKKYDLSIRKPKGCEK